MSTNDPSDSRSALWEQVASAMLQGAASVGEFRIPGGPNSRLAHWEPGEPTLRWFKSYLQLAAGTTPLPERQLLALVGDTNLGNPICVAAQVDGGDEEVVSYNLDYLYSAEEVAFLIRNLDPDSMTSICELGAGFGRTAHTLLKTQSTIESYTIVDLPETLSLSRTYLKAALEPDLYDKLAFVEAARFRACVHEVDLFVQIDGFQEMDVEVIDTYYEALVCQAKRVYICNPVGKYQPEVAGVSGLNPDGYEVARSLGRTRVLVDPWDEISLRLARPQHILNYCPDGYREASSKPSRLRPYYLHALYERDDQSADR